MVVRKGAKHEKFALNSKWRPYYKMAAQTSTLLLHISFMEATNMKSGKKTLIMGSRFSKRWWTRKLYPKSKMAAIFKDGRQNFHKHIADQFYGSYQHQSWQKY